MKGLEMSEKPPYNYYLSLLALRLERNKDMVKISNLHKWSIVVLRLPFLESLVRKLCESPYNSFYFFVYMISQAWEWRKWLSKSTIRRMFYEGVLNYKVMFVTNDKENGIFVKLSQMLVKKLRRKVVN